MILFDKESTIIRGLVLNVLNSKFLLFSTLKTKKKNYRRCLKCHKKEKKKKTFVTIPFYLKEKLFFLFILIPPPHPSSQTLLSLLSLSLSL